MPLHLHVDSQCASPYAMSVFVALREKGLDFGMSRVDLSTGEHRGAAFAAMSLTQRVPTLVHDDFSLSESSAITEYLDEAFPPASLYPAAPRLRARARQVQAWLRSDLAPLRTERPTEVVFYGRAFAPLSPAARAASAKLFQAAEGWLEEGAEHLFGAWSIADTDLALMLNRLVLHGDPVPARLAAYAASQWRRPSVLEWLALERPPLQA
jgi:glutathione S-transferase